MKVLYDLHTNKKTQTKVHSFQILQLKLPLELRTISLCRNKTKSFPFVDLSLFFRPGTWNFQPTHNSYLTWKRNVLCPGVDTPPLFLICHSNKNSLSPSFLYRQVIRSCFNINRQTLLPSSQHVFIVFFTQPLTTNSSITGMYVNHVFMAKRRAVLDARIVEELVRNAQVTQIQLSAVVGVDIVQW